ncbi:MAG: hypothetical protein JNL67_13020 [Planctomycetaceae bacterium]|nr:hypothetical protein [Planctomycetaceae bacterium]
MKISPEVREHWTLFLQGQLPASDHERLRGHLESSPELADTLAADARVHQCLLDHYAAQPAMATVLGSLPETAFGNLTEAEFVDRCLGAVNGLVVPQPGPVCLEADENLARHRGALNMLAVSPPVFDLDEGITFEEPLAAPPVAVQPPPICESPADRPPSFYLVRRLPHLVAAMTLLLSMVLGAWWLFRNDGNGSDSVLAGAGNAVGDDRSGSGEPNPQDAMHANSGDANPGDANPGLQADLGRDDHSIAKWIDGGPIEPPRQMGTDAGGPVRADEPGPIMAMKRGPEDFPRVIRGSVEEEPNFIKDTAPIPAGPQLTKIPNGQLMSGRDAQWQAEPGAWMIPVEPDDDAAENNARLVRLVLGEAQLILDNGLSIGMEAPAAFQFVSANKLNLVEGHFLIESKDLAAPIDFTVATDSFELALKNSTVFFVSTSREFGTGLEVLHGAAQLTPRSGLGLTETLSQDGLYAGQFLPPGIGEDSRPGAAALVHRDGQFIGQIVALQIPMQTSSVEVFGPTLQTAVRRMREAPADFERDWGEVVSRLEALKATNRNRPGLNREIQFAGDLLPTFPELWAKLGRGLAASGPFNDELIRQFAGQLNLNGEVVNLDNLEELARIKQELAAELQQLQAQREQRRGNRNRRNLADPDFMAQQMLIQQLQQIEMFIRMVQGLQLGVGNIAPNGVAPALAFEPVVATFTRLGSPEGVQDREAIVTSLRTRLADAFESDEQRAKRLQEMRDKLKQ